MAVCWRANGSGPGRRIVVRPFAASLCPSANDGLQDRTPSDTLRAQGDSEAAAWPPLLTELEKTGPQRIIDVCRGTAVPQRQVLQYLPRWLGRAGGTLAKPPAGPS